MDITVKAEPNLVDYASLIINLFILIIHIFVINYHGKDATPQGSKEEVKKK